PRSRLRLGFAHHLVGYFPRPTYFVGRDPSTAAARKEYRPFPPLGHVPFVFPPVKWDVLWLTGIRALGSLWAGSCAPTSRPQARRAQVGAKRRAMNAQDLLQEIADYCRHSGLAESTFGRRAVNDGKLTARLRNGGRITTETLDRIRSFMEMNRASATRPAVIERLRETLPPATQLPTGQRDPQRNFRFFDNRQKYLLFVSTCSEKWVIASRVALELANVHPRPPALRVFDAGVGDGTVLLRVMRAMHDRFPTT